LRIKLKASGIYNFLPKWNNLLSRKKTTNKPRSVLASAKLRRQRHGKGSTRGHNVQACKFPRWFSLWCQFFIGQLGTVSYTKLGKFRPYNYNASDAWITRSTWWHQWLSVSVHTTVKWTIISPSFSFFSDLNVNNNIKKPACSFYAPRQTPLLASHDDFSFNFKNTNDDSMYKYKLEFRNWNIWGFF